MKYVLALSLSCVGCAYLDCPPSWRTPIQEQAVSNRHYVLVVFDSEEPISKPERYVEGAVAEMHGCRPPDDPERTIRSQSVEAFDFLAFPAGETVQGLLRAISEQLPKGD